MTNGEKIQKDFKGCDVCDPIVDDDIIHVIFADKKDSAIGFDWSWWNMEYKEPTTKNDKVDCEHADCNNCVNHKYCDYEPTTKNDLGVDCISRAELIKRINNAEEQFRYDNMETIGSDDGDPFVDGVLSGVWNIREMVKQAPSVTPQERKGHWIDKQHLFESCSAECSSCHKRSNGYVHDNGFSLECKYYDYCPNCGARMIEPQESEDKE